MDFFYFSDACIYSKQRLIKFGDYEVKLNDVENENELVLLTSDYDKF